MCECVLERACGFGGPLAADLRHPISFFSLVNELSNQKKQKENQKEKRVREREALHFVEGEEEQGERDSGFEQQSKGFSGLGIRIW